MAADQRLSVELQRVGLPEHDPERPFEALVESMCAELVEAVDTGDMSLADSLPKPWDKFDGEGWSEFLAFQTYLSVPKRSVRNVAVATGLKQSEVERFKVRNSWVRRAEAHDWWWGMSAEKMRRAAISKIVEDAVKQAGMMPSVISDMLVVAKSKLEETISQIQVAQENGKPIPVTTAELSRLIGSVRELSSELRQWSQSNPSLSINISNVGNVNATMLTSSDDIAELLRGLADANIVDAEVLD